MKLFPGQAVDYYGRNNVFHAVVASTNNNGTVNLTVLIPDGTWERACDVVFVAPNSEAPAPPFCTLKPGNADKLRMRLPNAASRADYGEKLNG